VDYCTISAHQGGLHYSDNASLKRTEGTFARDTLKRHLFFLQQGSWLKKKMDKQKGYNNRYGRLCVGV